jgi:hypothetical protein
VVERTPQRIQLSRRRGWRKPSQAVVVARPTRWGNPFAIGADLTADEAVTLFRDALVEGYLDVDVDDVRRELRGHDLACWCAPGQTCHADVLLEVANHD